MVELVRLYSNLSRDASHLRRVRSATSSPRSAEGPRRQPRQYQRRLSVTEIRKLIKAYKHQDSVTELAKQFGIHRLTVTALLRRHGVEQRPVGLAPTEIPEAASLYGQGWSLVRLGEAFGVDASTVWRALRAAGVVMRHPGQSRQGRY
jgi:hypothetical protein